MIRDVGLVAAKEYREVVLRQGGSKASLVNLGLVIVVFGVFMPLQAGASWVEQPWMLFAWSWLPLFLVTALVSDSFAGERERHTLETLLTTALSDSAILFGKMAAAVSYGYGMLLLVMVVSLATVNLVHARSAGRLLLFPAYVTASVVVFGFLVTLLVAALGVMISLKAKTVRQAGQTLSLGILGLVWFPALVLGYVYRILPDDVSASVLDFLVSVNVNEVLVVAALVLAAIDAVFVVFAMRRFKRAQLTFD